MNRPDISQIQAYSRSVHLVVIDSQAIRYVNEAYLYFPIISKALASWQTSVLSMTFR